MPRHRRFRKRKIPETPQSTRWAALVREKGTVSRMSKGVVDVAYGVVVDDTGRVLLGDRADGQGWNLPGGLCEPGESPAEAVIRETFEETGLHVIPTTLVSIEDRRPDKNETVWIFTTVAIGGNVTRSDEMRRIDWFDPDQLPDLTLPRHAARINRSISC